MILLPKESPSLAEVCRDPRVTNYKCQTEKVVVTQGFSLSRKATGSNLMYSSYYDWNGDLGTERKDWRPGGL